jgi:protease-4
MFLPRREEDAAALSAAIDHIYQRFIAVVARGRSMDAAEADKLGRGQVWLGSEALANGLVDETGGLEAAKAGMETALGSPVRFIEIIPGQSPVTLMGGLRDLVSGSSNGSAPGSAIPETLGKALNLATELEELGSGPQTLFADYLFRNRADY